ncbi:MAG: YidH family protein [Solirubrobacteraceae bacterium]
MPESDGEGEEPQQLVLMRRLVDLSLERTGYSAQRTAMSAERSYMSAERTLSVWIRTALASMVVGIAVDRFGLSTTQQRPPGFGPDTLSTRVGAAMVAFGVLIAVVTGVRFRRYAAAYCENHVPPQHHGPFMAPAYALLTSLFGVVLVVLLLAGP